MSAPPLNELLRWLADMPPIFHNAPPGRVSVRAVIADLFETLFGTTPGRAALKAIAPTARNKATHHHQRWMLAAAHLMWHPAFRLATLPRPALTHFLAKDLHDLAAVVPIEQLGEQQERREELIRKLLSALGWRLPGESEVVAADRLAQVDSVMRQHLLAEALQRERRARQVRNELNRKALRAAAAKVTRE